MRRFLTRLRLLVLALAGGVGASLLQAQVTIPPEPLNLPRGSALSTRALVQAPLPIRNILSWTVETKRHRAGLYTSAVSPDGKWIATGGLDGTIRIWDAETGAFARALVGHGSYVHGLEWSPDGKTLASAGSFDYTVRLWDHETGRPLRVLKGLKAYAYSVAWSRDGRHLAISGGTSGLITHWDVLDAAPGNSMEVGVLPTSITWSPDGSTIIYTAPTIGIHAWNPRTKQSMPLAVPEKTCSSAAWSPDGKLLLVGCREKTLVWDAAAAKAQAEIPLAGNLVAWSPDGKHVAVSTGTQIHVRGGDFSSKGVVIPARMTRLSWKRPDRLVGSDSANLWVFAPDQPKPLQNWTVAKYSSIVWSPGRPVISNHRTASPRLWSPVTGKKLGELAGLKAAVLDVAWSRDSSLLATASQDKMVHIWDNQGKLLHTLEGHGDAVTSVSWGLGKTLASGSNDNTVRLWSVGSDSPPRVLPDQGPVSVVAWSREGRVLAIGDRSAKVRVYSEATGRVVSSGSVGGGPVCIDWHVGGRFLAVGLEDGKTSVLDASCKEVISFPTQGSPPIVSAIGWLQEGPSVVVGRGNHTVQILRPGLNKQVLSRNVLAPVVSLETLGRTFVLGCNDRCGRWFDSTGKLLQTCIVDDEQAAMVNAQGHFKCLDEKTCELVYVAQTERGQETLSVEAFAERFSWKNSPTAVLPPAR